MDPKPWSTTLRLGRGSVWHPRLTPWILARRGKSAVSFYFASSQNVVQGGPADAKDFGGARFVAVNGVQNLLNVFLLRIFERHQRNESSGDWFQFEIDGKVQHVKDLTFAHHAGMGDQIFQLAHVSRPAVLGKEALCAPTQS